MEIGSIMGAAGFLSGTLGQLGRLVDSGERDAGKSSPTPGVGAHRSDETAAAMRRVLANYDVTDISPHQFSEMLHQLQQAGALTDQEFRDLSMIRLDLDLAGIDSEDPVDLIEFYTKRGEAIREGDADFAPPVVRPHGDSIAQSEIVRGRLEWMRKIALVQSGIEGLDATV